MPMTCERNLCPTGEGRDGTGPSSRYEGRIFQHLLHCAQEKRWVMTNLGSAHLDAQDADAEPRLRMHPSPSSVCSIDLKTRTSMCRYFRATGYSCGSRSKDEHISTGPALRAVPIAPCLHEVAEAALVPLREQGVRILNYLDDWLILAQSQDQLCKHRDWCSRTSASWAFGSTGKRANSSRCRGSLFSVWSLDSVNQTARLTQERAQSVLNCLNTFKNRTAAPLKQVSEAPGAYGGCSGGHTAGAAPYETASTLAPWPSPEVGVAERHAAGPSHSSLPPNLHPVVRPFIPSGRSAPGTGLQARCGLHGCLRQWLGGHVQRAYSVGGLDGSPTALAYQLPRVAGSTPGLEPSQETLTRRARTGPYGQHCDRCVHQPTRWSTLPSHVATRPPPPPESEASEVASRHSYSGLAQPDSRRAVTSCAPRRMETPSPDGPADLRRFGLAQVDLFASLETSHCQLFYSLTEGTLGMDALAHSWPRGLRKYAFPPVSLLAQTLCKVREEEEQILLVAPYWPTRTWFPELMLLVTAPPWQIPLRKHLLTQRRGALWHPRPDLWKLHVWSLDGMWRF